MLNLLKQAYARVCKEKYKSRFLLSRILWHSRLCSVITFRTSYGYHMRFYPSSVSAACWIDSDFRSDDTFFIYNFLRSGDIFVDVGANVGQLSLAAASEVGPCGRVIAIEPHPKTHRYLVGNIRLNSFNNIESYNAAIGDTKVNLLKVDVEGYELFVFEGGTKVLEKTHFVYFENSESNFARYGYSSKDLHLFLRKFGFIIYRGKYKSWTVIKPEGQLSLQGENLVGVKESMNSCFLERIGHQQTG